LLCPANLYIIAQDVTITAFKRCNVSVDVEYWLTSLS